MSIGDDVLAQAAARHNLGRHGHDPDDVTLLGPLEAPPRIDTLVMRLPGGLALLEHLLRLLAPALHAGTTVVAGGMTTEVRTATLKLFETHVGPTRTTRATRKARLVLAQVDPDLPRTPPQPTRWRLDGSPRGLLDGVDVVEQAGVFAAGRLDVGTRVLLEHLPAAGGRIADLGCGSGLLGLAAGRLDPTAHVVLLDSSHLAVASARATVGPRLGDRARFVATDCLGGMGADGPVTPGSLDRVVTNPPFHSHRAVSDATVWRMLTQAHDALRPGGDLWVVANRHLGHGERMRRVFGG